MNKKPKNIEQLYSESFNDFRVEPSSGLWKKISTKLAWRNFFSFNPTAINAYYVAGLLTIVTAGALWIAKPVSDDNQDINEITINKTTEIPVITTIQKTQAELKETTTQEERQKAKGKRQKVKVKKEEQEINKDIKPVSSSEVSTKADNQKTDSCINDRSPSTQQLATSTRELETRPLKPATNLSTVALEKMDNNKTNLSINAQAPGTQHPASSSVVLTKEDTDLPDPWPNIDSLFTNNTPTPPQHSIQFPNAFTPNSNGPTNGYYTPGLPNNDVFHPVYKGVVEYHLSIFNRRGELIFESKKINVGWDGYINDRLSAQGVYIWKARGIYSNGENFIKAGNVMLIIK